MSVPKVVAVAVVAKPTIPAANNAWQSNERIFFMIEFFRKELMNLAAHEAR